MKSQLYDAGRPKGWCHIQYTADDAVERACRLSGAMLLDREVFVDSATHGRPAAPEPGKPVEGCWFCLSNPTADTDLVVSIGMSAECSSSFSILCLLYMLKSQGAHIGTAMPGELAFEVLCNTAVVTSEFAHT